MGPGRRKLTTAQAREIRRRYNGRRGCQTRLAREFGIGRTTLVEILMGRNYKDAVLPGEPDNLMYRSTGHEELPNCVWRDAEVPFAANH